MKRPRHLVSTLLLPVAMFALGWWIGSITTRSAERDSAERNRIAQQIDYVLASSVWINAMIEIAHEDPAERDTRFRNRLIMLIYDLARLERFHTGNDEDVFLMHASNSLQHLGVSDITELESAVRHARLIETAKAPFVDETHGDYETVRDFVTRALAYKHASTSTREAER